MRTRTMGPGRAERPRRPIGRSRAKFESRCATASSSPPTCTCPPSPARIRRCSSTRRISRTAWAAGASSRSGSSRSPRRGYACLSLDFRGYGESDGVPAAAVRGPGEARRARCPRVDRRAAVVHRQDRDLGHLVRRQHGAVDRLDQAAVARRDRHDPRHRQRVHRRRLAARLPRRARRRGRLGLPRARGSSCCRRSGSAMAGRIAGGSRLDQIEEPFSFAWHSIPPETWETWETDIEAIDVPTLGRFGLARLVSARDGRLRQPIERPASAAARPLEARAAGFRRPQPGRLLRCDGRLVR